MAPDLGFGKLSSKFKSMATIQPHGENTEQMTYFQLLAASADQPSEEYDSEQDADFEDKSVSSDSESASDSEAHTLSQQHKIQNSRRRSGLDTLSDFNQLKANLQAVVQTTSIQAEGGLNTSVQIPEAIAQRLGIKDPNRLVGEVSGWLLKDILCQGKVFLSTNHLFFYALLPFAGSQVIMEATLRRKSSTGLGYSRYWHILRPHSLASFTTSSDPYFPSGNIPISSIRKCCLEEEHGEATEMFTIVTDDDAVHCLKADSPYSAEMWVKAIQRLVFMARNDGEYVKVVMPLDNIKSVTKMRMLDMALCTWITFLPYADGTTPKDIAIVYFSKGEDAAEAIVSQWTKRVGPEHVVPLGEPPFMWQLKEADIATSKTPILDTTRYDGDPPIIPQHISENLIKRRSAAVTTSVYTPKSLLTVANNTVLGVPGSIVKGGYNGLIGLHKTVSAHIKAATSELKESAPNSAAPSVSSVAPSIDGSFHEEEEYHDETPPEEVSLLAESPAKEATRVETNSTLRPDHVEHHKSVGLLKRHEYEKSPSEEFEGERVNSKGLLSRLLNAPSNGFNLSADPFNDNMDAVHHVTGNEAQDMNEKFQSQFMLSKDEKLIAFYRCLLCRTNGQQMEGILFVSGLYVCFRRTVSGSRTRMILPIDELSAVALVKDSRCGNFGFQFLIKGHDEIYAELYTTAARADFLKTIQKQMSIREEAEKNHTGQDIEPIDQVTYNMRQARLATYEGELSYKLSTRLPAFLVDPYTEDINDFFLKRPYEKLRITILTIGSRGDVQPYIALCQALMDEGHTCKICTHAEFKDWIEEYGIGFAEVAGDPKALMQIMIDHGSFSFSFFKEAVSKFRGWVTELLESAWLACQDSDLLIESPSAMAGVHIAEALGIPYFRAFTMPWTRTHTYPHAFIVPESNLGGSYNYMTYIMFENMMWRGTQWQVNRWRKRSLGIKSSSLEGMRQQQIPFLYCVSPHVLVPPIDQPDWIHTTGYWELEKNDDYKPDERLVKFMEKARQEKKPLVYIGFGSIIVDNLKKMDRDIREGVRKAGVYAIVVKGWSDRSQQKEFAKTGKVHKYAKEHMSDDIFLLDAIPHQWLFPKIDAAVHHGGSGTTGMSLRCGIPTIIKPFFGDQFFYATRVVDLGCGLHLKKLSHDTLASALTEATTNQQMRERAKVVGEQISTETGVMTAIQCLYRELPYAKSLIRPYEDIAYHRRKILDRRTCTPPAVPGNKEQEKEEKEQDKDVRRGSDLGKGSEHESTPVSEKTPEVEPQQPETETLAPAVSKERNTEQPTDKDKNNGQRAVPGKDDEQKPKHRRSHRHHHHHHSSSKDKLFRRLNPFKHCE